MLPIIMMTFLSCWMSIIFTTDGTSCPMSLYWPHCEQAEGELVGISDLAEHPCAGQKVGLNRNTSFLGIHQCPTDFQWKGRNKSGD